MIDNLKQLKAKKKTSAGQKLVIKLGGSMLQSQADQANIIEQLAALWYQGHDITVVHGAGPQINKWLQSQGVVPKFCAGWRITDGQTLMAVVAALGQANTAIVEALEKTGIPVAALHAEPSLFQCTKKQGITAKGEPVDLGWVGEIMTTNADILLKHTGSIKVVSPIGADHYHNRYNINADHAAFALAAELKADKLVFVSDVPGVMSDKNDFGSIIPTLYGEEINTLIDCGKVSGGMIPKLMSCIASAQAGVKSVSIICGSEQSGLVGLIDGTAKTGTTIYAGYRGNAAPIVGVA